VATVSTGIDLSKTSYDVPDKQVLYVDGALGIVEVRSGASIKGDGSVGGLKVEKGGILAPGHSPGCLSTGDLVLLGTYQVQIGGADACKGYDQVKVKGAATISGTLDISTTNNFTPHAGQSFTIINNDGTDAIFGTFSNMREGATIVNQNVPYAISYKGGDGNDVVLTVTAKDTQLAAATAPTITKAVTAIRQGRVSKTVLILAGAAAFAAAIAVIGTILYLKLHHKKPTPTNSDPTMYGPPETPAADTRQ
jgi:uncharacterized protein with beta-barrel porin domain